MSDIKLSLTEDNKGHLLFEIVFMGNVYCFKTKKEFIKDEQNLSMVFTTLAYALMEEYKKKNV